MPVYHVAWPSEFLARVAYFKRRDLRGLYLRRARTNETVKQPGGTDKRKNVEKLDDSPHPSAGSYYSVEARLILGESGYRDKIMSLPALKLVRDISNAKL